MFCVMCQQMKAEAGSVLPGRFDRVCMACFHQSANRLRGVAGFTPGLPDPHALAAEARQRAEAAAAEQRQRLDEMHARARAQAETKLHGLAGQVHGNLQNGVNGLQNDLGQRINALSEGTGGRVGNALNKLNDLKGRFR